jgi:hypothetical protein
MENRLSVYETPCLLPEKALSMGFQTAAFLKRCVRPSMGGSASIEWRN